MANYKITEAQARQFILRYQQLSPPRSLDPGPGILELIKKLGCIQFDPLNKAGRNADLVLASRIKNYKKEMLYSLLYEERTLLDIWDKCMSISSTGDWSLFSRNRERFTQEFELLKGQMKLVHDEIVQKFSQHDFLSSKHIDNTETMDWSWTPTRVSRACLDAMFYSGELIVSHREGNRKYYGLAEKFLPADLLSGNDPNEDLDSYYRWYVKRRINALGLLWNRAGDIWVGIHGLKAKERNRSFSQLLDKKEILSVEIEGLDEVFYLDGENAINFEKIICGANGSGDPAISFITPLDNFIWDRNLISQLFHFEYRWEVYTPASKRKYGYYVLPVLYGDKFIARFEPVFNEKSKILEIINWWWEEDEKLTPPVQEALEDALKEYMNFLGAQSLSVKKDLGMKLRL